MMTKGQLSVYFNQQHQEVAQMLSEYSNRQNARIRPATLLPFSNNTQNRIDNRSMSTSANLPPFQNPLGANNTTVRFATPTISLPDHSLVDLTGSQSSVSHESRFEENIDTSEKSSSTNQLSIQKTSNEFNLTASTASTISTVANTIPPTFTTSSVAYLQQQRQFAENKLPTTAGPPIFPYCSQYQMPSDKIPATITSQSQVEPSQRQQNELLGIKKKLQLQLFEVEQLQAEIDNKSSLINTQGYSEYLKQNSSEFANRNTESFPATQKLQQGTESQINSSSATSVPKFTPTAQMLLNSGTIPLPEFPKFLDKNLDALGQLKTKPKAHDHKENGKPYRRRGNFNNNCRNNCPDCQNFCQKECYRCLIIDNYLY